MLCIVMRRPTFDSQSTHSMTTQLNKYTPVAAFAASTISRADNVQRAINAVNIALMGDESFDRTLVFETATDLANAIIKFESLRLSLQKYPTVVQCQFSQSVDSVEVTIYDFTVRCGEASINIELLYVNK